MELTEYYKKYSENIADEMGMSEEVKDLARKNRMIFARSNSANQKRKSKKKIPKYSKYTYHQVYMGYDFLKNLTYVRTYIQRKHSLELRELEFLLTLYPMSYFSRSEYIRLFKPLKFSKIETVVEMGLLQRISVSEKKSLYYLSRKSRGIVEDFYALLSGEKKFPMSTEHNPMKYGKGKHSNGSGFSDKKKYKMMEVINQMTPSDSSKELFE